MRFFIPNPKERTFSSMKTRLITGLLCLGLSVFAADGRQPGVRHLKILTIGNSFANSVFPGLKNIVKKDPGCKITLDRANLGGCTVSRHWELPADAG